MIELPSIEAEITFLPESEGGRTTPPVELSSRQYRPHLVVGDPNQRKAITIGNQGIEEYLAVGFVAGPDKVMAGESFVAELALIHGQHPVYRELVPGATFTIREGSQIVGYGRVTRFLPSSG